MKRTAIWVTLGLGVLAAAAAGKGATVTLKEEGVTLELVRESGPRVAITSKGTTLKAGTHNFKSLRLLKPDDKGRVWEMRFQGDMATCSLNNITLDEGQDKVITEVEPVTFQCALWQWPADVKKQKTVLMRFTVAGRHSETYYPGAFLKGEKPPLPEYRVLDEKGRVIGAGRVPDNGAETKAPPMEGKLAPMHAAAATFQWDWIVPAGFTGKFTLELTPVMGPFQWKTSGTAGEVK